MSPMPEPAVTAVISLVINGAEHSVTVDTRTSLLDLLRENLGLIGAKKGCGWGGAGVASCGSGTSQSGVAPDESALSSSMAIA